MVALADCVSWLFNIRAQDVTHAPFVLAFALLHADGTADLFSDPKRYNDEVKASLGNAVRLLPPGAFFATLDKLAGQSVLVDPNTTAAAIVSRLQTAGANLLQIPDPCLLAKARKNPIELEGARQAHIRDGVAVCRFLAWLAREAPLGKLTEIDVALRLEALRRDTRALQEISFDTISGAGPHGAVVHYRANKDSNRIITSGDMVLIDSGAQYLDGTTDVTRTVIVGTPSEDMRNKFTAVLKGHIALATARFPEGTTGLQLDGFARRPLWDLGLDYDHGTGHGVGAYLSVHEGPQSISKKPIFQSLLPGMICSNEPGYYKEGAFGIRIENLMVVTEAEAISGGERQMMAFQTLTLAPIERALIEAVLLTAPERVWLNAYHARVWDTIGPSLLDDERDWLRRATWPILDPKIAFDPNELPQ